MGGTIKSEEVKMKEAKSYIKRRDFPTLNIVNDVVKEEVLDMKEGLKNLSPLS